MSTFDFDAAFEEDPEPAPEPRRGVPPVPQLAATIPFSGLDKYLNDPAWGYEQKLDGDRRMIAVEDGKVFGINRSGGIVPVKRDLASCFDVFNGSWLFDGELLGGVFCCFDMPRIGPDPDFEDKPYSYRRTFLNKIMADVVLPYTNAVMLLPTFTTTGEKLQLMQGCINANSEGIMAKRFDSPYHFGKRTQTMLKAKLWASIDCVVMKVSPTGKRSIRVAVYDHTRTYGPTDKPDVNVGDVTVTDKRLVSLNEGDVVEIKYLYGTADRKLYQPSFLRMRPDRTPQSCDTSQLKIGDKKILLPSTLPKGN